MLGRGHREDDEPGRVTGEPFLRIKLSDRERQIAELIADGESYEQIGQGLNMATSTVRTHVVRMAQKIDMDGDKALPPRHAIYVLVMHERWSRRRAS